ncbi:MAG TPA: hypothetical protein PLL78_09335 [Fimbriimonadaceae bacterium]|nr:hypothetical protein [Fimbriimonadaceae bacterium]
MSATTTKMSLRQMAEEAYAGFERERIDQWRRKSRSLLLDRLERCLCLDSLEVEIQHRTDGTAYAAIDGFEFEPPANPTPAGLYLINSDGDRHRIMGLVDLGAYLKETEGGRE